MKISIGGSRKEKKWVNRDIAWEDFIKRAGHTIRTVETVSEYRKLPKNRQDEIKDVGGFVGGQLKEGRRKNGNVLCRSMLTLDMDHAPAGTWQELILDCVDICLARLGCHMHSKIVGLACFSLSFDIRYSTGLMYPK